LDYTGLDRGVRGYREFVRGQLDSAIQPEKRRCLISCPRPRSDSAGLKASGLPREAGFVCGGRALVGNRELLDARSLEPTPSLDSLWNYRVATRCAWDHDEHGAMGVVLQRAAASQQKMARSPASSSGSNRVNLDSFLRGATAATLSCAPLTRSRDAAEDMRRAWWLSYKPCYANRDSQKERV
jgi:hypothetical protein